MLNHKVLNVLLQLLDDGRLTDSHGRTVDFTNVVVVLTSNVGAEHLLPSPVQSPSKRPRLDTTVVSLDAQKARVLADLRRYLRPELLNRLDDVIVFEPLGKAQLRDIVQLQLRSAETRLQDAHQVSMDVTTAALDAILDVAYDPQYGARPLKRYIEKHVVTALSRRLLDGSLRAKGHVTLSATDGSLTFEIDNPDVNMAP
ncbi:hypothetical protein SPRG_03640 [Saprolegnia parasitica CBS 223.65]|uniref:Clp ATPase C-terminal domain-containing protein n=1 Tax=Saprolegnia parasitica (strain CBS 223.65) TaxID=695850 RepID=A0A067CML7_SAPPC|nr:hypothetical protein SPRG_03640 [Saprolegnia parasitica CBS 223.65]KDO31723.1 hypothetical protein SPRG_03640 [Saprolegnia parasitica CBS 223.65]|eukprot:XP_012197605.1 hypothetical protein SPRG_03640 [Saprolegnia parasitica CBS 223.65]